MKRRERDPWLDERWRALKPRTVIAVNAGTVLRVVRAVVKWITRKKGG